MVLYLYLTLLLSFKISSKSSKLVQKKKGRFFSHFCGLLRICESSYADSNGNRIYVTEKCYQLKNYNHTLLDTLSMIIIRKN